MQAVFSPMTCHLCRLSAASHPRRPVDRAALPRRVAQGSLLAASIATLAWRLRALSGTGALAATVVGAATYAGMGIRGSSVMVGYFLTSSALGRLPGQPGRAQRRGNRRDAVQVLANGGLPAAFSILHLCSSGAVAKVAPAAFAGSLATAAADTWATEVGVRWGGTPRSIVTGRRLRPGESGGVTICGLAAAAAGALTISAASHLGEHRGRSQTWRCAIAGISGSLVDSLLGATIQEQRWCKVCNERTEQLTHSCGHRSEHLSGLPAVNNDIVNFLAVLSGGLVAAALSRTSHQLTERKASRVELPMTLTNSRLPGHLGPS
jgi:uncharacterized protein (TIGR00297 family)